MTPPLLRVKQGTLIVDWCDFDGGPGQAIQVPADTGHVNLTITNNDLGSDLLDVNDSIVTSTPPVSPIVFISTKPAPAPYRVDALIQNNRFSERTDNNGGKSISYGSSNVISISGNTYKGTSGTPQVAVFEDYPTLIGGDGSHGIAPRLAFGTNGVVTTHTTISGGSGSHGIAPRLAFGGNAKLLNRQLIDGGTLGIGPVLSFGANGQVRVGGVRIVAGLGIAPRVAFGTNAHVVVGPATFGPPPTIDQSAVYTPGFSSIGTFAPHGIPSEEDVYAPRFTATSVSIGTPTSIASLAAVFAPVFAQTFRPVSIGSAAAVFAPTFTAAPVSFHPAGIPSAEVVYLPTFVPIAAPFAPAGIPSQAAVYTPIGFTYGLTQVFAPATIPSEAAVFMPGFALQFGEHPTFARMLSSYDVEKSVVAVLQEWMPRYIAEVERQQFLPPRTIPQVASWVSVSDLNQVMVGQALPSLAVVSTGPSDAHKRGDGTVMSNWPISVFAIAHGNSIEESRRNAALYAAAARAVLMQKGGDLGGLEGANGIRWITNSLMPVDDTEARSIAVEEVRLEARINSVSVYQPGPVLPLPDPYVPPIGLSIVREVVVELTNQEVKT